VPAVSKNSLAFSISGVGCCCAHAAGIARVDPSRAATIKSTPCFIVQFSREFRSRPEEMGWYTPTEASAPLPRCGWQKIGRIER
jgi:hypothetical protein